MTILAKVDQEEGGDHVDNEPNQCNHIGGYPDWDLLNQPAPEHLQGEGV